jgi:hypothetical protein
MPAYVRACMCIGEARPAQVGYNYFFFVDHCLSVRAYDTHVDALVDTRPGPTYPANTGFDLESTLCAGNCLVFFLLKRTEKEILEFWKTLAG